MNVLIEHPWKAGVASLGGPRPLPRSPLVAVAGCAVLVAALVCAWREVEPLFAFRPVMAVIVSADVARAGTGRSPGMRLHGGMARSSGFVPDLNYRYDVDGHEYFSSSYSRTAMLESRRQATQRIAGFAPGLAVTAWYNPWLPEDAVLARAPNPVALGLLAAIALLGAALLAGASRPRSDAAHDEIPDRADTTPLAGDDDDGRHAKAA